MTAPRSFVCEMPNRSSSSPAGVSCPGRGRAARARARRTRRRADATPRRRPSRAAFASGDSEGATSVRSLTSASSSICAAIAAGSAPTCCSTCRTTSSWVAAQSRCVESTSRLPHSIAFCAACWSSSRVASLKYCVTSICSAGRRGRVVVVPPAAPGVRPPRPLSPKKSEKNSSKRLLPPNGDRPAPRL